MNEGYAVESNTTQENDVVRFFRGSQLLGTTILKKGLSLCEHAESVEIKIPTSCTSGTCGTCMVRLISGSIKVPKPLPEGLDEEVYAEGARLSCICVPKNSVDIDLIPPL